VHYLFDILPAISLGKSREGVFVCLESGNPVNRFVYAF